MCDFYAFSPVCWDLSRWLSILGYFITLTSLDVHLGIFTCYALFQNSADLALGGHRQYLSCALDLWHRRSGGCVVSILVPLRSWHFWKQPPPPLPSQDFPDATPASRQDSFQVSSFSDVPPGSCPPPPAPPCSSASSRSPVPQGSSHPPLSKRRASSSGRRYCSVPSCPDHCTLTSRGWSSFGAMKGHCDRHLGGCLDGALPLEWLQSVGYGVCEVCNRILSSRFRGRCPSCWPAYIASMPRPVTGRPLSEDMPSLDEVLSAPVRLRSSVSRGAFGTFGVPV